MVLLSYYSVLQISLGDAMAIIFSSPVFTIIFEWIFVQKPRGISLKLMISLVLLSGVILIIQPPFFGFPQNDNFSNSTQTEQTEFNYGGMSAALSTAIIGGLCNVSAWYCTKNGTITSTVLAAYSGATGLFVSILIGLIFSDTDRIMSELITSITAEDWGWIVLVSVLSILAFWSQMASLRWIAASTLGSLQALEVLFAYFVQIVVMEEPANALALIGSTIVIISVSAISLTDKILSIYSDIKARKSTENPDIAITKC